MIDKEETMADIDVNPDASNGAHRPLPPIQVEYYPDTRTLHVHNGLGTSDGETVSEGLTGFYDAKGNLAGFLIWSDAEVLLKPFVDAISAKRGAAKFEEQDGQGSLDSGLLIAQE